MLIINATAARVVKGSGHLLVCCACAVRELVLSRAAREKSGIFKALIKSEINTLTVELFLNIGKASVGEISYNFIYNLSVGSYHILGSADKEVLESVSALAVKVTNLALILRKARRVLRERNAAVVQIIVSRGVLYDYVLNVEIVFL